jgi:hypothetical protein
MKPIEYNFFNNTKPNLDRLEERLKNYCSKLNPDFNSHFTIYQSHADICLVKVKENVDYPIFVPDKKDGYVETHPFYCFWLDQYCMLFENALWKSFWMEGGKKAEKNADDAVLKFRKEMQ